MIIAVACVLIPLLALGVTLPAPGPRRSLAAMLVGAVAATAAAIATVSHGDPTSTVTFLGGYGLIDATARLYLLLITFVYLGVALYAVSRVQQSPLLARDITSFVRLSLLFLSLTCALVCSGHLVMMWVLLEAGALCVTPLIHHHRGPAAFRAAWRYLLFSSVGLGLAFLGLVCLGKSLGLGSAGGEASFFLADLARAASSTPPAFAPGVWRRVGTFLVLFGLGTKLGLAPLYSWLPETYDHSPPSVTALMAAIQFNAAALLLFRFVTVIRPVEPQLISVTLISMGLASILIAAINIVAVTNYKRLIAYAAVNHSGVLAIGLGLGKVAAFGVLLYALSNALVKALLFLTCGSIKARFHTKNTADLHGLIKDMPYSGIFFMAGVFALLGFAPFGSFFGEVIIMSGLIEQGRVVVFTLFCIFLTVIFVATGRSIFPMIWGEPTLEGKGARESLFTVMPNLFFVLLLFAMGIYLPAPAISFLRSVAANLGGA